MKTSTSKNRRPLKWTHNESGKYHVYTYTNECGCGIEAVKYNTNYFVMSNSAGFHEIYESYKAMQNEAARMIDEDDYHQFEWILPDGTEAQSGCHLYRDDTESIRTVEVELQEIASSTGIYIWWRADHQKDEMYESEFAGAYRVLGDCTIERDGISETWLLNYQQPYYDKYGNWDGWYSSSTSPEVAKSIPYKADSYHAAKLLAADWLSQQPSH